MGFAATATLFSYILLGFLFLASADINACKRQQVDITAQLSGIVAKRRFISEFVFKNDSKPGLQIAWAGPNSKTLVAITLASYYTTSTASEVYRSTDDGQSFSHITDQISPGQSLLLLTQFGLQRNTGNSSQLYLASAGSTDSSTNLHVSLDGGATWRLTVLPFAVTEPFVFHETQPALALARSGASLFLTRDGGISWARLKDHVVKAAWGSNTDEPNAIYVVRDASTQTDSTRLGSISSIVRDSSGASLSESSRLPRVARSLLKTADFGDNWRNLTDNIFSYVGRANFLFVSRGEQDGISRRLEVSTDYGASFHRTSLPSISSDSFASLMDVSNGLAFVYVDSGRLNGYGTLYTSDARGRLFSKSLERHLYPPGGASDFYRVESMPGTYLTSVRRLDGSLGTLITHNHGADWEALPAPVGVGDCPMGSGRSGCQLQLVSEYSISTGQVADLPVSLASAPGLLVAHGHVGASLLPGSVPDVYVSSNGGHSWTRALIGPHKVQLGNNGGFMAAVPIGTSAPRLMKFSTDAGRCWHSFPFTNEDYRFTGFVSEPGSRASSVAIWGYSELSRHWRSFVVDFSAILTRPCSAADYEPWLANGALSNSDNSSSRRACVFGAKETMMRLKPERMCANSYSYAPSVTVEPCNCTKEDFGCEFGYMREFSGRDCVRDPSVPELDVCTDADSVERILTDGYRKLPGNLCVGGFAPNRTQQTALQGERCSELLLRQQQRAAAAASAELRSHADAAALLIAQLAAADAEVSANNRRRLLSILLPVCGVLSGLLITVLALVLAAKLRERRRRLAAFHYSVVSSAGRQEDAAGFGGEASSSSLPVSTKRGGRGGSSGATDQLLLLTSDDDDGKVVADGSTIA